MVSCDGSLPIRVKERLAGIGFDAFSSTPGELAAFVREDLAKWTRWVKEAGIEPE